MGDFRHTDFRITHCSGGVSVNRTKVTLTVHQHVSHAERLRHTNNGVIHSGIAVRVILTDYITDHTGRFFVRFVVVFGRQKSSIILISIRT